MSNPYTNSGEPELRDLKGNLWRLEKDCWIDTHVRGKPFTIPGPPPPGGEPDLLNWIAERNYEGRVTARKGYLFDGSSIPFLGRWLDNRVSSWPGMVHDITHEAMRAGELKQSEFTPAASLYGKMMRAFGSWWITGKACFVGLFLFGRASRRRAPEYAKRVARSAA